MNCLLLCFWFKNCTTIKHVKIASGFNTNGNEEDMFMQFLEKSINHRGCDVALNDHQPILGWKELCLTEIHFRNHTQITQSFNSLKWYISNNSLNIFMGYVKITKERILGFVSKK